MKVLLRESSVGQSTTVDEQEAVYDALGLYRLRVVSLLVNARRYSPVLRVGAGALIARRHAV